MKIYLILLLVTRCLCLGPITLKNGMKNGTILRNFGCNGEINETKNINKSLFLPNGSSLLLAKTIDLKNDFTHHFDNNTCLNKINDGAMSLKWFCKSQQTTLTANFIVETDKKFTPRLCFSNCSKIKSPFELPILENTKVGHILLDFKICDEQLHSSVDENTYASNSFIVSGEILDEKSRKSIILKEPVDYERKPRNTTSTVSWNNTKLLTINIKIVDADDQGIEFKKTVYHCNISENLNPMSQVTGCKVEAYDLDPGINQTINYTLFSVTPSSNTEQFKIFNNGSIQLLKALDREKVDAYYITVKGFQSDNEERSNFTSIVVKVDDVDDNKPEMLQTTYNVSLMENSPRGTFVCTISATDKDIGANAEFTYQMNKMNSSKYFAVNASTGVIIVTSPIDREMTSSEQFQVYAKAKNKQNWNSTSSTVNVIVMDENDNTPELHHSSFSTNIKKTMKIGTVLMLNVSDPDEGANGEFDCKMLPKSDYFKIRNGNDTCNISLTSSLNETQQLQYIFDVTVNDKPNDLNQTRSSSKRVTITVSDVNIHLPEFGEFKKSLRLLESTQVGTLLVILKASDKDPTDNLTFKIETHGDKFEINDTNRLYLAENLDREKVDFYNISVTVTDGEHTRQTNIDVTVTDVNDNAPIFELNTYAFNISEEQSYPNIGHVYATDADLNGNGQVVYFIDDDSMWKMNVSVDNKTGNISTNKIDRERLPGPGYISFFIFAKDKGIPSLTNYTFVKIYVEDINDNIPVFLETNVSITVVEDTPVDYLRNIYKVQATDLDKEEKNERITYQLDNDYGGLLNLNSETGVLSMLRVPLINKNCSNQTVIIKVTAQNNSTYVTKTASNPTMTITIHIEDINNNIPVFKNMPMSMNVTECTKIGTQITRFRATDLDCSEQYNTITYWTEKYVDKINIDPRSGNVTLIGDIDVDFASNLSVLNITVYATDDLKKRDKSSNHTVKSFLSLILTDCNDNAPLFEREKYVCYVKENKKGTFNCSVKAKDGDKTPANIEYRILNETEKNIIIEQKTGELSLKYPFDYEKIKKVALNISASDGELNSSCLLEIRVVDVNDERPQFHDKPYNFTVYENVDGNFAVVGRVNVTDVDSSYDIRFKNCAGVVDILGKRDVILKKPLDYETTTNFSCILSANDTINKKDEIKVGVVINVLDKNDNRPIFAVNCCDVHPLKETTGPGFSILNLTATDADKSVQNNKVSYSISSGNSKLLFKINKDTGEIKTNSNLTGYGGINIHLVVNATDNGVPSLSGYTNVTINVTKENVNAPKFVGKPYTTKIYEGKETRAVFQVHAQDKDNDNLNYTVMNFSNYFYFNDSTLYAQNIDAEVMNKTIYVKVYVTDGKWSDMSTVNISILDVNDNFPRVNSSACNNKTVKDTANVNDIICRVTATDKDVDNKGFTYILYGGEGDFEINRTSGVITLKNKFGRNGQDYNMTVIVIDSGSPPKNANISIAVHVKDTNPSFNFSSHPLTFNVTENDCKTNMSLNVKSVDLAYTIISDNEYLIDELFDLDEFTGLLTLANKTNCLDFENIKEYTFNVSAKDKGVFPKSARVEVKINVVDVNEPPKLILTNKTIFLKENSTKGTKVSRVKVQDPDTIRQFRNFTFSLSDNNNFTIDMNGTITTAAKNIPANTYDLNVTVTDGGGLDDSKVINVHVPNINITQFEITVSENNNRSTKICDFATEMNGELVEYRIIAAPYTGNFKVKNGYLVLDTLNAFDREEIEYVSFYVVGYYAKYGIEVANISVKLHIQDINDCPPYFAKSNYTVNIDDVTKSDTVIGELDAIDRDIEKQNKNLTYSIETHTDNFDIDNNGNLILKSSKNLEVETPYSFNVTVSDGKYSNTASVSIVVADTNNFSPIFYNHTYEFYVVETNKTNIVIGSLSAEDKDIGRNGNITFSILTENADDIFVLSNQTNNSCIIKSMKSIDREAKDQYTLVIQATDLGSFPRQSICIVNIKVIDENDNYPIFRGISSINGSIIENSKNGTITFPNIFVYDVDYGINGTKGLVYMLNDTKAPFCVSTDKTKRPSVYLCGDINRETKSLYYLELIASDANGENGSHKTGIPLLVHIIDVNDEIPKFSKDRYTFNVTENQGHSTNVGNVSITDKDSGTFFLYRIISGDDEKFVIDSTNGMIYAVGIIDRETKDKYTMNISVSDGINKAYTIVDVDIIDINDNAPQFGHFWNDILKESLVVEVLENTQTGVILNLTAFDKDATNNGLVNYSLQILSKGGEPDVFSISENGGLTVESPLDREKCDFYEMNITASDKGVPKLSSSIIVRVKVLDENDNSPAFCDDSTCSNITESSARTVEKAPVSSVLKVLMTHDPDVGENAKVSFTLIDSSVSSLFKLETVGTSICLVSINKPLVTNNLIHKGVSLSADVVQVNVTVVATDGGGLNSSLVLHIFVEPLNDDMPVFDKPIYNFNISENMPQDSKVGKCHASTNDTIKKMSYALLSGYTNKPKPFGIDKSEGVITTSIVLDRETAENYVFAVQVRDGRTPERTAFAAVRVTVDDTDDNPPVFLSDNITIHVTENRTVYIQKNVSASDLDSGENGRISYSLQNSFNNTFLVDKNGILTINGTFDYEKKTSYAVYITAFDEGSPPLNTTSEINIVVKDENDNFPVFHVVKKSYNVSESNTPFEIFTVNATDKDAGLNGEVIYKIQNIDDVPFAIDPFNGSVYLQSQLDYEANTNYLLSIVAQDLGSPPKYTIENVTIYVTDVYDDIIMFDKNVYEINVTTSTSLNDSVLNVTVSVSNARFSLKGTDSENFKIGEKSGEIVLAKSISSERQMYVFQAVADDRHGRNTTCTVITHVIGHDVKFESSEIKVSLVENLDIPTVLVDLNTTAEFSREGATYTITEVLPTGRDLFSVDKTTGILRCIKPLDRESQAQYNITISAHTSALRRKRDTSSTSSSIQIVVNVDDVNDNPPHFTSDQERVFGVPDNVRANYIVGVIKGHDNDTSDAGKLRYNVTGGRADVFGVSRDTGEIKTLVAIASTSSKTFDLIISVSDGDVSHKPATINITIHVVPTKQQPILTVNLRVDDVNRRREEYRRNMSAILGIQVQFERIESHREVDGNIGLTRVDLSKTDLIFHGINTTSGYIISNEKMEELLKIHNLELARLFGMKIITPNYVIIDVIADPSAISATQILFICMAVFIFFGSLAALVVAQYSWTRYETECQKAEKNAERLENEIELSTIRSRQSSKLSSIIAAAAVNPAFTETELTSNGMPVIQTEEPKQFETQEMHMIFGEEPLEAILNAQGLGNASQSVVDSGVGHTSVQSDGNVMETSNLDINNETLGIPQSNLQVRNDGSANGEGPVMTSSPRISRETKPVEEKNFKIESKDDKDGVNENKKIDDMNQEIPSQETRGRTATFLLLDATGESETDDNVEDSDVTYKVTTDEPEEKAKPKKVVRLQVPSDSTSQEHDTQIILLPGTCEDSQDNYNHHENIGEGNLNNSDFESTSF